MRNIFTQKEIDYLENTWTSHKLSVDEGWDYIAESEENLSNIVYGSLWAFYASSGYVLGDAQDRAKEIIAAYRALK